MPPKINATQEALRHRFTPTAAAVSAAPTLQPTPNPAPQPAPDASLHELGSEWWRRAVVYQVYVRSFCDADGDGVGDLAGVVEKLPYLAGLGVDGLWLNPFYASPGHDHGYDVADHCAVDPAYGSLEGFDDLVAAAHGHGIRVILDVVPNHASIAHPWFTAALAAGPGSPARARFHFADGRGPGGNQPPNNWRSIFGGPAWTRISEPDGTPGQWYLHTFAAEQPDFNWTHPDVPAHFEHVLRFWLDRGVDGFRVDVAQGLHKKAGLPDHPDAAADEATGDPVNPNAWNQPAVHQVWRSWRRLVRDYTAADGRDRLLIGEVGLTDPAAVGDYTRPGELHHTFCFPFAHARFDAQTYRSVIDTALRHHPAGVAWVANNHDLPRSVTRHTPTHDEDLPAGTDPAQIGLARARAAAAAALMLALPGAVYLYQGEELGLPDVLDLPPSLIKDPMYHRSNGTRPGRDGCRVPLPWTTSPDHHHGFSPPATTTPAWLPQPPTWADLAADTQHHTTTSTLNLYRQALALRRTIPDLTTTTLTWHNNTPPGLLALSRGTHLTTYTNTTNHPIPTPHPGQPILTTHPTPHPTDTIPPNTTVWYHHDTEASS
ncbi:glycoside hydrolase family 13 protein [Actinopolymorpha rutila]|uniref:Alpha-glucosidase n=2 Tax=Actinopolymorpha rutila TaxID=446787 RepID=A0A852ZNJ7_9ACTN|nr:glycoside hydrolase family 13 protein [Actinopolymorpha rutila]NYH93122.1 alpha-glucosidase [Actinopolymorpha rutila]